MGKNPGNEKHGADVKKDEEHGRDVEFDRVAGFAFGIGRQATFVRRILDFARGGFLPEKVACSQNANAHPDGQRIWIRTGRYSARVTRKPIVRNSQGGKKIRLFEEPELKRIIFFGNQRTKVSGAIEQMFSKLAKLAKIEV